jgi:hypothetical protein
MLIAVVTPLVIEAPELRKGFGRVGGKFLTTVAC